jgi:Protein of unknown function (DUF4239)
VYWIYDIPNWVFAIGVEALFWVLTIGGVYGTRALITRLQLRDVYSNDLIGYFFGAAVGLYGLTLGLISVGAWENFGEASAAASDEAAVIASLYRDFSSFPEPKRSELRASLKEYTRYVIEEAWPLQQQGKIPIGGTDRIDQLQQVLYTFETTSGTQQAIHQESMRAFNRLVETRRKRLYSVTSSLPAPVWMVALFGGLTTLVLSWIFDVKSVRAHVMLAGLYASIIGMLIFLMAAMDNPFRGEFSVTPDAFELVYQQLMQKP